MEANRPRRRRRRRRHTRKNRETAEANLIAEMVAKISRWRYGARRNRETGESSLEKADSSPLPLPVDPKSNMSEEEAAAKANYSCYEYACYFEVYRIDVKVGGKGLDRIKMDKHILFTKEQDVILDNQQLVFRGPELPPEALDPVGFLFGPSDSWWFFEFDRKKDPSDKILSLEVKDPDSDECFVIHCEHISKAVQAHLQVSFEGVDEDVDVRIAHGQISAVSGDDYRTKRLLLHIPEDYNKTEEKKLLGGGTIDLLRSVIASHLNSSLVLEFDLTMSTEAHGGGTKKFFPVNHKLTFTSPNRQPSVNYKRPDLEPDMVNEVAMFQFDVVMFKVDISWFNDETPIYTPFFGTASDEDRDLLMSSSDEDEQVLDSSCLPGELTSSSDEDEEFVDPSSLPCQ